MKTATAESEAPTEAELPPPPAAAEAEAEEAAAGDAVVIIVNEKGSRSDVAKGDFEKMCRICHLSPDRSLVQIGCGCKNELGTAHPHCADTWFRLRGNRCCEICGLNAKNIKGNEDGSSLEDWYDDVPPSSMAQGNSSERAASCWRGQPFWSKTSMDKYRSHIYGEGEKNTQWRFGAPPKYGVVNKLFEQGRTKEWPKGSLEETVQNAIKTWEMELSHKTRLGDFKTINPDKFRFIINGRKGLSGEETLKLGSYNALLQSSLPEELQCYRADDETFESSHELFRTALPRGFAWEVVKVYTGPPEIAFKFRHWGYMEGPYKGHAPTGEMVQFTGIAVLKVDETLKMWRYIIYDPGELFGGLLKGPLLPTTTSTDEAEAVASSIKACPFFKA